MPDFHTVPFSDSILNDSSSGRAATSSSAHARPEQVGPYRIVDLIGEGGMGEVYKAERRHPIRQTVAVKIIKLGFDSREIVGRFESERQALAMMDHPGIAKVLDAGTTETGRPYFVMDFVAGKPITQFCDENRLSIGDRLLLFSDVCDAISHAHTKAIIHRDIKPSNVLAYHQDAVPAIKVIDFGVAKAPTTQRLTDLTVNTQSGRPIGTYECMSPEQVEGSADIDTRTDVYSLGVLLYELLTGAKPFDQATMSSSTDDEIRRIIREVDPPRPSTRLSSLGSDASALAERRQAKVDALARELRGELEWIPLKAMRKERARRYASVLQLKEDIENYLDRKPLIAGPESRVYRAKKFLARNRRGVVTSVTVLIALITGVSLYIHNIRAERAEAQRQAAISRDSLNFLNNVFVSASPANALGNQPTVIEAMNRALASLDDQHPVEPAAEAAVRSVFGMTLHSLGRYDEALPQLHRAVELDHQYLKPNDGQRWTDLINLGRLLMDQDKATEAEPVFQQALAFSQAYPGKDKLRLAQSLSHLGMLHKEQRKFADAEAMFRQALEIRRKALAPNDPAIATAVNNLASLYWSQGRLADAEPLVRESLEMRRNVLSPEHPNIAQSLNNLSVLLREQKKLDEAEPLAREALQIRRKVCPPDHPDIAVVTDNLARILQAKGKLADAEPLLRETLKIRAERLGASNASTIKTAGLLADVLVQMNRPDDAAAIRREYRTGPTTQPEAPATQPGTQAR